VSELRPLNRPLMPGLAGSLPTSELSLLDLADRLLSRGVVVAGEATISVAGIDLIYLGLNVVLASVETLREADERRRSGREEVLGTSGVEGTGTDQGWHGDPGSIPPLPSGHVGDLSSLPPATPASAFPFISSPLAPSASPPPASAVIDIDPDHPEDGLARLVLTVVELIRQLLERQAIRRMEGGGLSETEVERLGLALLRLQEKLYEMAAAYGLQPDDLNINLGPLGNLL